MGVPCAGIAEVSASMDEDGIAIAGDFGGIGGARVWEAWTDVEGFGGEEEGGGEKREKKEE